MNSDLLLKKAIDAREPFFSLKSDNCFRLFHTDGDGLAGLTIDLYGEYILIQYFIPELEKTAEQITGKLLKILSELSFPVKGVMLKNRTKDQLKKNPAEAYTSRVLEGSPPPSDYTVIHNGLYVSVDLISGQNTGLFFDMRDIRNAITGFYKPGGKMLNLFCYTGFFSLHALKHGLSSSINVDISNTVLKKAGLNYELNGFKADHRDFKRMDAIKHIKYCIKKGLKFDFAVFDPPSFARNKKTTFSATNDYPEALELLSPICSGGYALTAINSRSISRTQYFKAHPSGWKNELFMNESSDFPHNGNPYLKVGLWKVE